MANLSMTVHSRLCKVAMHLRRQLWLQSCSHGTPSTPQCPHDPRLVPRAVLQGTAAKTMSARRVSSMDAELFHHQHKWCAIFNRSRRCCGQRSHGRSVHDRSTAAASLSVHLSDYRCSDIQRMQAERRCKLKDFDHLLDSCAIA
jgi:hypothetical protein